MLKVRITTLFSMLILSLSCLLLGCHQENHTTLKIGTIVGPETQILDVVKKIMQTDYHLTLEIVPFTDYQMPNAALNDGSIDANMFQHLPFLQQSNRQHHYHLTAIGKTFIFPMGVYSTKIKSLAKLNDHAKVGIPNDPSNETRALLLLQAAKLIELRTRENSNTTLQDITENSKQLQFIELDAAQLPRAIKDLDIAVINTNYAIPAGLNPMTNALYRESNDSVYANVIAVREDRKEDPRFQQLLKAFYSEAVIKKAEQLFGKAAIPAWRH